LAVAVYTDITDVELAGLLAGYDLGEPRAFKGIAEGIENSNFLLETDVGRYILTVYERRVAEADLPFFLQLMQHLARRGFPCPTPQPDRRGRLLARVRDKPAAIVSFLPGVLRTSPQPRQCREAGEGLARLHLAAEGFGMSRPNSLGQPAWGALFAGPARRRRAA
jgi:homoserine kinase type II